MSDKTIEGRPIIIFGEDWGGLPSSTQHLAKHFAQGRKVLWVNSIGLRQPRFSFSDFTRAFSKLVKRFRPSVNIPAHTPDNVTVTNFLTIPAPKSKAARNLAKRMLQRQLSNYLQKEEFKDAILWTSLPTTSDVFKSYSHLTRVYYCGDDFNALSGVDHDTVSQHETDLLESVDLVLTASEKLKNKFAHPNVQLLSHGVDKELFEGAKARATDLPKTNRPTVGFYGSISEWFDVALVRDIANALPSWNIVVVGKNVIDISELKKLKNVHLLGPKAHEELPRYSQHWDVSILPFVQNAQIHACNPLKLYEYLSVGKPIVSRDFPAIAPFKGAVQIANTSQEFIEAIKMARYANLIPEFKRGLQSLNSGNSWQEKATKVDQWIKEL